MKIESRGRAVVVAPSLLGSRDHPAGPSKIPLRRIRQAMYPPRRIRRRNVEKKDPWRVSRHDNLPSSPSMASRNEVWKTEGVSTFFRGVLVRGHGIHITPGFGGVRARTPPKLGSNGIRDKCTNTSSSHTNLRWRFA